MKTIVGASIISIIVLFGLLIVAWRLTPARNVDRMEGVPLKTSPDGIKYKIFVIEGRKFVATQTYNGYWTLAGPIE